MFVIMIENKFVYTENYFSSTFSLIPYLDRASMFATKEVTTYFIERNKLEHAKIYELILKKVD